MVCKILRIEASFGCKFIIIHYRYLHYPAWIWVQRYSSALQSFKGLVSTFGTPRSTNMYRSRQVKLPRSPWRDASSAPFGQILYTSNEKHWKGFPTLPKTFELSASKWKELPSGVRVRCIQILSDHCWSRSDICSNVPALSPLPPKRSDSQPCFSLLLQPSRTSMSHDTWCHHSMACNTGQPAKLKDKCGDLRI